MKNITIFFNCHGFEIKKYLETNVNFIKNYNIQYISILSYIVKNMKFFNNTILDETHINIIKKCDVLILQVIEKDRGFLNNNNIIKLCKKDCLIIKIPHYRNSIYEYKTLEKYKNKVDLIKNWKLPTKIKDINNIKETITTIKNEINIMNNFSYDKKEMLNSLKFKLNEFEKVDNLSDIKLIDFYKNNYKKYRLFKGRSYPASIFFHELTNRILIKLKYKQNKHFKDFYFAENTSEPIPDYWYKYCNFTFDNIYFIYGHIEITEYEWYYILLLSYNYNIINKDTNMKYISTIRKTINKKNTF